MTRQWIKINNSSRSQYSFIKNIRFKTPMLRSDLCGYSDAYIILKEAITVKGTVDANRRNQKLIFKNNTTFKSCISKIINTLIDNAEDLYIVI